ncbi:hypothetical protein [Pedobacter sp. FW305-3-2-15-E-R2A2]|uniref:hypothetical protein n=1 Tax=Pedobacter sp. FW305-3-2-15-E-R2A2 TaxID=3140251 RepID=UPI0031407B68
MKNNNNCKMDFLNTVVHHLTMDYDYKERIYTRKNDGKNTIELSGKHYRYGEHLIMWNLDNDNHLAYITAIPKTTAQDPSNRLKEYLNTIVSNAMEEVIHSGNVCICSILPYLNNTDKEDT